MLTPLEIEKIADGLATIPEDSVGWVALSKWLGDDIDEANDFATHPDTHSDQRDYWAGRERGLRDLRKELAELRSKAYLNWPEMKQLAEKRKDGEE